MTLRGPRLALLLIISLPALARAQPLDRTRVRDAVTRGFAAIQAAQKVSRASQPCALTCHLQANGALAYRDMRAHGIAVDDAIARADFDRSFRRLVTSLGVAVESNSLGEVAMNQALVLVTGHAIGLRPNVVTAALARAVALKQNPAGDWTALGERPPTNHSLFTFTALGLRALQLYGHRRDIADTTARVTRAKSWLQSNTARDTEDRTFQLLGLWWAGADPATVRSLSNALAGTQRADGGWNSRVGLDSDAYSTAEALVALHDAGGMSTDAAVWRRGAAFLLRTQAADGTWHVRTRLPPWVSPPYYESGYPYGRDQFISTFAANWSVSALSRALGPPVAVRDLPLQSLEPSVEPWVETAMFGASDELKALLDAGLKPDAATAAGGTSLLMLALPSVDKVRLLLERGADVNALSRQRNSALLVGAQYPDANAAVRLLLARGARVTVPAGQQKPVANASPTFVAAHGGNTALLAELQRSGAAIDEETMMFDVAPVSPLGVTALYNHLETARTLLALGAKVDPGDARTDTPLVSAVVAHHVDMVRLLVDHGADVNRVDERGMTPLMYAAVADFADSTIVELLLRAGARTDARDKQGQNAADYARSYGHTELIGRLSPR